MEKQDKFNQPSVNEPMKQSVEQPDTDSKPTIDATGQSTSDETDDSGIFWDPKRPGCPDLKYYKGYWSIGLYTALIILGCIVVFWSQIFEGFHEGFSGNTSESGSSSEAIFLCLFLLTIILPPTILSLMTRSAFRWRKPNAVFLYRSQAIWNLVLLSGLLFLFIPAFSKGVIPNATGHFDCYLFTIDCNKYLDMALGIGLWFVGLLWTVGAIYMNASRLVESATNKSLLKLFPLGQRDDTLRDFIMVVFISILPILALTIIPFVLGIIYILL